MQEYVFSWVSGKRHLITTPSRNYCQVSGLSKVAGYWRKLPPTWSVSAGYSASHFFTDGIFLNKISLDWPFTLTTQLSISKILTTLSIQINGNLGPLGSYFAEQLYSHEFQHAVIHWYYSLPIKIQGPVTWQIVKFMFDPHGKAHFQAKFIVHEHVTGA